ncbi:MAG TPA: VOC family protein [Vicinamibacterales bacterium]|nr:VOC family protein [Vicinamibacterales bacterium]
MPHHLKKLTPNLIVADVERSLAFYRDVLGFTLITTVPDVSPYVFAILQSGDVSVFVNAPGPAFEEYPALKGRALGGTLTLFIDVEDVRGSYAALKDRLEIVMPIEKKWYGPTEFAFLDPDGYIITFAQTESGA